MRLEKKGWSWSNLRSIYIYTYQKKFLGAYMLRKLFSSGRSRAGFLAWLGVPGLIPKWSTLTYHVVCRETSVWSMHATRGLLSRVGSKGLTLAGFPRHKRKKKKKKIADSFPSQKRRAKVCKGCMGYKAIRT